MAWPTEYEIRNLIRNEVISEMCSLGLQTQWIGDPSTSTFGIKINLTYNGSPIGEPTIIDFVGKTDN